MSPLTSKTVPPVREVSPGRLPPPTPDSGLPQSPAVANLAFDSSLSLSPVELNKGKLQFHSDLIEALRQFAVQHSRATDETTEVKTRERILEQALAEQNQILEVMQKLITSLEMENKSSREKINSQARKISEMTVWEARAKRAEDQLRDMANSGVMGSSKAGMISFAAIAGFEKVLAEKDQLIASLQAKLESIPLEMRHRVIHEDKPASSALIASARAKLEAERVRVLELEEELCSHREELSRVRNKLSEKGSILIKQESEILHLRHEMEVVKKFGGQQQDVVMSLQTSLTDKDLQLTSLTRALNKEKKTSEQLRSNQQSTSSPHTANCKVHPDLFELVLGRNINTFELRRTQPETQLGFSFTKIDLPVSSKVPCLVVRAVKEASIADGVLHPGDEILEVNGFSCRSAAQSNAVECLEKAVGTLKLVVARDQESTDVTVGPHLHSTPVTRENESTKWATAFSDLEGTPTTPEFVSVPSSPHSSKAITLPVIDESKPLSSIEEQYEETDVTMLRSKLEESKHVQLELENELDELKGELDDLQVEYDLTKGENFELQQHVSSHAVEMGEIREHVSELQQLLKQVEEEMTEEQERAASLHARNQSLAEQLQDSSSACEETKKEVQAKLEKLTLENNEKVSALQDEIAGLSSQHDQLISEASEKDKLIEELRQQLQTKSAEYKSEIFEMQGQNKKLQEEVKLLHENSTKNVKSTEEEVRHLTMQLNSAKAVLMEAEMKESSMKIEMKHLKQATDLANQQLAEALRSDSRLREEIGTYKQLAETKTVEMESLTIGLKAAQSKLTANKDIVLRLQKEVDNLRRNNASLQNEKGRVEEARSRIESRLRVEESERISMEERLQSSTDEKDVLFRQLEDSIAEVVALQQQVEVLNTKLQVAQGSAESSKQHQAQLEKQVKELSAMKRSLEAEFTKEVEVLKAEKKVLEQEVTRARSDAATTLETSQSSVDQASLEMKNLQEELKQQQKALIASEGEKAWLLQECESLKKSESRCSQQVESLRTENEALTHTVSILKTAKEEAERECNAKQKRVEELDQQCNGLKEEVTSLERSSELLRRKAKESGTEIERFSRSQQEWEDQMLDLQLQLGQLSKEVEQKTRDLQESATVCEQLREELTLEKTRREQLKVNADSLQEANDNLQALKKQSDELVTSMEFVHKQDQGKLDQLVDLLQEREKAVRRTTEELATLRSETQSQLQQLKTENISLSESIEGLKSKLQANEQANMIEVSDLREQLRSRDCELSELKENVRVQKDTHRAIVSELQATASHATNERCATQKSLDIAEGMKNQMELDIVQLQNQIAQIESEKQSLETANVTLSSESVRLKQQMKQYSTHVDDLSAKLQALEMNLEVANRSLEESERGKAELEEKTENLSAQLSKTTSKFESLEEEAVKTSLELHARDEIILQLKTNLDLRQSESAQLQQSLIVAQNAVSSQKKKVESLEGRKHDLESTIEQLMESQEALKNSLLTLEAAKTTQLGKHSEEIAKFTQEIEDLHARERDHLEQIRRLDLANSESQNMTEQLLASQKALQQSLAKLGDEKDVEIIKLCNQVTELESSLSNSKHQLSGSRTREVELQTQVQQLEEGYKGLAEQFKEMEVENEQLRSEVELHKATAAQISELSTKVSSLEETLGAKSNRLAEVMQVLEERESELKVMQEENGSLLGKVSELASVKVSLAEKSAELEKVQGEMISEVRKTREVVAERDQLLSMLRKLEVEKHTEAVQQPTPKLSRGADKEQLLELLKEKEEEAFRLREYVGKLLTNVVEKAPFVLENMH